MLTEAQFTAEFDLLRKQNFWNAFDNNQLKLILGTMIAAGLTGSGGGGYTATSPADIAAGIDGAIDIDTLIASINTIRDRTPTVGAGTISTSQSVSIASDQIVATTVQSIAIPVAQTNIVLPAGGIGSFQIPFNAKSVTICISSSSLVHYTEDGTTPTNVNCWFVGGSREIWDSQIPAGWTIKFLAIAAATISIQVRVDFVLPPAIP